MKTFEKQLPVICTFCKVECIQKWVDDAEEWNPETRTFDEMPAHVSHNCPNCRMSYQRYL